MFPRFVIGLVLLFLLPTLTVWFSLDHRRNVSDRVVSGIGTLFSLDRKLYASENQPFSGRLREVVAHKDRTTWRLFQKDGWAHIIYFMEDNLLHAISPYVVPCCY